MTNIAVAGTFNRFHKGHKAMLDTAFSLATEPDDRVFIGVTTQMYATMHKEVPVRSYHDRCEDVMRYINSSIGCSNWNFFDVNDSMMISFMRDIDILVVSEETKENGNCIRASLAKKGKDLKMIVVPLVKNANGTKLSSTDIIREKYDEDGNTLDEPPDDAICTREVKHDPHKIGEIIPWGKSKFRCHACGGICEALVDGKNMIIPTGCLYPNYKCDWQEVKDKLSDKEFNEIADAMEQVGKDIGKEKQLNNILTGKPCPLCGSPLEDYDSPYCMHFVKCSKCDFVMKYDSDGEDHILEYIDTLRRDKPLMQPNSDDIKKLEEQFTSDEYIEELHKKQQTDCSKCIYVRWDRTTDGRQISFRVCTKDMCMDKPICPLFNDGKEVK